MSTKNGAKYISKLTNEDVYKLVEVMQVFPKRKFAFQDLKITRHDYYIDVTFLPEYEKNKTGYIDGNPDGFRLKDFKEYDNKEQHNLVFNRYMEKKFGQEYQIDKLNFENTEIKERMKNNFNLVKDKKNSIKQKESLLVEKIKEKEVEMTNLFDLLSKNKKLHNNQSPIKYLSQLSNKEIIKIVNLTDVFPTNRRGKRKISITRKEDYIYIESGNFNRYNAEHYDNYRGSMKLTDFSGFFFRNKELFENRMLDKFGYDYAYDKLNFEKNELAKEIDVINESFNTYKDKIKEKSLSLSTIYDKNLSALNNLLNGSEKDQEKDNDKALEL